jgi:hypothetical protein
VIVYWDIILTNITCLKKKEKISKMSMRFFKSEKKSPTAAGSSGGGGGESSGDGSENHTIPHLQRTTASSPPLLVVNNHPFLILGGELQNSSMTSAEYMSRLWHDLTRRHVNTVFGAVPWDNIEPLEGQFDFTELDQIILDARRHNLHLVLLWFGSWKNGVSSYVPAWVKRNARRFPRARVRSVAASKAAASESVSAISARLRDQKMNHTDDGDGDDHDDSYEEEQEDEYSGDDDKENRSQVTETLSVFHPEALRCDAKAFGTLMRHIKEIDEAHSTVIMVQVENEVGLLGDSRDRSPTAERKFAENVPQDLLAFLHQDYHNLNDDLKENLAHFYHQLNRREAEKGSMPRSWEALFGRSKHTDEIFMAYHYAKYVDQVTAAGKAVYPIPHYTNVWLNSADKDENEDGPVVAGGGGDPGDYPSGGSVSKTLDIWQRFAPHLDFISPDIYLNNYETICRKYRHRNQPLLIPEQRRDAYGARRVFAALGSYQALGTSPFGIDTMNHRMDSDDDARAFRMTYSLLESVSDIILEARQRPNSMRGFFFDELSQEATATTSTSSDKSHTDDSQSHRSTELRESSSLPKKDPSPAVITTFGNYEVRIERSFVFGRPGPGAGIIIHLPPDLDPDFSSNSNNINDEENSPRFLLIGYGFQVSFRSLNPRSIFTGILENLEKEVVVASPQSSGFKTILSGSISEKSRLTKKPGEKTVLKTVRRLNGDETRSGRYAMMPSEDPDYGGFPIAITIPARTMIAEVRPYSLVDGDIDDDV